LSLISSDYNEFSSSLLLIKRKKCLDYSHTPPAVV
jgi:hypothetical protein